MKKRGIFATIISVFILGSVFVGCTSSSGDKPADSSNTISDGKETAKTSETEIKTLDMFWFSDGIEGEVTQKIIDDYESANPNIKINLIEVPHDDMRNKIMMSVSGGEAPALARTTETILSGVHEATVDFRDYGTEDEFLKPFMPSLQNYFVINNKICAVPIDVTANGMYYNKTAFEKAGVKVPTSPDDIWTWDEFVQSVKQVMEKGDVRFGLVIDNPTHRWSTMLYEFGGQFMSKEGPKFNSPQSIEAINFTKKLFDDGIIPTSTWLGGEDPNNMFRSGQVAVHLSGNWMMTNYRDNIKDFEWGVTYLPIKEKRSSVPGGKQITAFANSGVEQEAVDFIKYFTSNEINAKYCIESTFLSPRLDNANIEHSFGTEYFKIFADELANTVPEASFDWGFPGWAGKVRNTQLEGMYEVISGRRTAEEHVKAVDAISQEVFDEQNK